MGIRLCKVHMVLILDGPFKEMMEQLLHILSTILSYELFAFTSCW